MLELGVDLNIIYMMSVFLWFGILLVQTEGFPVWSGGFRKH